MARLSRSKTLREAGQLKDLLLYQVSGGIMGRNPKEMAEKKEIKLQSVEGITFGEKLGLFNGILKLNEQEEKYKPEGEEQSPFLTLKRGMKNGSTAAIDGRSEGDDGQSASDDSSA